MIVPLCARGPPSAGLFAVNRNGKLLAKEAKANETFRVLLEAALSDLRDHLQPRGEAFLQGSADSAGRASSRLNRERKAFQRDLNQIGGTHSHVCADCKGKCCGGARERDAFIDRVLQVPDTSHFKARKEVRRNGGL